MKLTNLKKNKKRGFTLIELIIVIAILGILALILVPSMSGIVNDSKVAVNNTNARMVYSAAQQAYVFLATQDKEPATGTLSSNPATPYTGGTKDYMDKVEEYLGAGFDEPYTITIGTSGVTGTTYGSDEDTQGTYAP